MGDHPRAHGVLGDERVPERRVELRRAARAEAQVRAAETLLQVGAGGRPVGQRQDVDEPGGDRRVGVLEHDLPRAATDAGGVDPAGPDPHELADLDRCERAKAARHEAVDVVLGEARVGDRACGCLLVQRECALVVDAPAVRQRRAHDRDAPHPPPRGRPSTRSAMVLAKLVKKLRTHRPPSGFTSRSTTTPISPSTSMPSS